MVFGSRGGLRGAATAGECCREPAGALHNVSGRLGPWRTLQAPQGPLRDPESTQIWPVQQKSPTITESTVSDRDLFYRAAARVKITNADRISSVHTFDAFVDLPVHVRDQ